jgi:hypothetical protein
MYVGGTETVEAAGWGSRLGRQAEGLDINAPDIDVCFRSIVPVQQFLSWMVSPIRTCTELSYNSRTHS